MNTIDKRKQALLKGDLKREVTWPPKSPKAKRKYYCIDSLKKIGSSKHFTPFSFSYIKSQSNSMAIDNNF